MISISHFLRKLAEIKQTVPRRNKALEALGLEDIIKDMAELEIYLQTLKDHPTPLKLYGPDTQWVEQRLSRAGEMGKRMEKILDFVEEKGNKKIGDKG